MFAVVIVYRCLWPLLLIDVLTVYVLMRVLLNFRSIVFALVIGYVLTFFFVHLFPVEPFAIKNSFCTGNGSAPP